jgi:hypothetical protein
VTDHIEEENKRLREALGRIATSSKYRAMPKIAEAALDAVRVPREEG